MVRAPWRWFPCRFAWSDQSERLLLARVRGQAIAEELLQRRDGLQVLAPQLAQETEPLPRLGGAVGHKPVERIEGEELGVCGRSCRVGRCRSPFVQATISWAGGPLPSPSHAGGEIVSSRCAVARSASRTAPTMGRRGLHGAKLALAIFALAPIEIGIEPRSQRRFAGFRPRSATPLIERAAMVMQRGRKAALKQLGDVIRRARIDDALGSPAHYRICGAAPARRWRCLWCAPTRQCPDPRPPAARLASPRRLRLRL